VPSSSAAAYGNNDCRKKLAAEFKKLNALHRELEENPCDLAAIHAYESYKKKREEERKACNIMFCPSQPQSFSNASLPKEKTSIRAQQCLAEVNADKVITFDDLSEEQRQGYEVLKNKRKEEFEVLENKLKEEHKAYKKKLEEEDLQFFHAMIKKNPQDNVTLVEETKSSPPCSNQVEPSEISKQEEEALHSNKIHEENKNDSASMVNSVIEAESKSTCADSIESKDASFIGQDHGECKTTMLDFSGCKGAYMLPCEFCANETDDCKEQKNIAEQYSVDEEHQSEDVQNSEQQEDKMFESHPNTGKYTVQVMQLSYPPNVFKEVYLANNLLIFRFGQSHIVDVSISKIFMRNFERPMRRSNFFVRNIIATQHIGQHVAPFRKTDSEKLLQPRLSTLFHLNLYLHG
jgi:hypothetical protein